MQTKKLDPDFIDGQTEDAVYEIPRQYGVTQVFVPQGVEVRTRENRHSGFSSRNEYNETPQRALPNTFCAEDALVIPFEDMADFILARSEPASLAKALWTKSDEVRWNLEDELRSHYAGGAVTDKERREFVTKVSGAIMDVVEQRMATKAADLENKIRDTYRHRQVWNDVSGWWTGLLERIRYVKGYEYMDAVKKVAGPTPFPTVDPEYTIYKVAGSEWCEARNHWRVKAEQMINDAGWLDMKDAPMDGTKILVQDGEGDVLMAAFTVAQFQNEPPEGYWRVFPSEAFGCHPICWRPLPAPKHFDSPSDTPF